MLNLVLSFDYELFFNDTEYTEEKVLIEPTFQLAECLNELKIKGTFFVDTACLIRYKELDYYTFPESVRKQLQVLLDDGHDIQLHIHPIWFNAKNNNGKWVFDNDYYMLDAFQDVNSLISQCKNELDDICSNNINYTCRAFRAGGFCLVPERDLLRSLYDNGIRIDSSVYPRTEMATTAQKFNYKDIKSCNLRKFDSSYGLRSDITKNGLSMIEVPVGVYYRIPSKWILTHGMPPLNYPPSKGLPTPVVSVKQYSYFRRIINRFFNTLCTPVLFTLDSLHEIALTEIVKQYANISSHDNEDFYLCAIGHPKFQSIESINNMKVFLEKVSGFENVRILTMKDIYGQYFDNNGFLKYYS